MKVMCGSWLIVNTRSLCQTRFIADYLQDKFKDLDFFQCELADLFSIYTKFEIQQHHLILEMKQIDSQEIPVLKSLLAQNASKKLIVVLSPDSYQEFQSQFDDVLHRSHLLLCEQSSLDYIKDLQRVIQKHQECEFLRAQNRQLANQLRLTHHFY